MLDDSDKSLVETLRQFGEQRLAEVLSANFERLLRIVDLRLDPRLAGRLDAADVVQEAFLAARERLPRYLREPRVPVFVWLRGVLLDALVDIHRRHLGAKMRDAGREVPLPQAVAPDATSVSLAACLIADLTSPSQAAIREETARKIEEVLEGMDPIDREVLILRHFEQLSNDEVAGVLGVKKAAASRRYTRAVIRFREVVEGISGLRV